MELSPYPIFKKRGSGNSLYFKMSMFSFVTDVVFNYSETYLEMKQSLIR